MSMKTDAVSEILEEIECVSEDLGAEIDDFQKSDNPVAQQAAVILQDAREALDALIERQALN